MMISPTGSKPNDSRALRIGNHQVRIWSRLRAARKPARAPSKGFTLVELMLVMAMLLIVLGVAFPSLKNFFRGRDLDSEARRFLSLTRYGQSRAVSEGAPMLLWIDHKNAAYGLEAQPGYLESDPRAVKYALEDEMEIVASITGVNRQAGVLQTVLPGLGRLPAIRFTPDGFIGESSPAEIVLRRGNDDEVRIVQTTNRLKYAIEPTTARR